MTHLLYYTIAAFGLAYIVGHSRISLSFRERLAEKGDTALFLVELIECPACLGFWIGFLAALVGTPFGDPAPGFGQVILGCYTCGANYLLARLTGWLHEPPSEKPPND